MRGNFAENIIGKKYGRLTVVSRAPNKGGYAMWNCLCECGNECTVYGCNLRSGKSTSCGCYRKERAKETNITHGDTNKRLYHIWQGMRDRCKNPKNKSYSDYGGRGISVCAEWDADYGAFRSWALGNGYRDDLSIDRIENDKGYSPDNCRWSTMETQQNHRREHHVLEYDGKTMTVAEWARHIGISAKTLHQRLKYGWSIERALTEPLDKVKARRSD